MHSDNPQHGVNLQVFKSQGGKIRPCPKRDKLLKGTSVPEVQSPA